MKLAIVGGGSTYTPELIDGFARHRSALPLEELVLVDPDPRRLELVGGMARRMLAHAGHPVTLTTTSDVRAGVDGADAVLLQLRVGGQDARSADETWPHEAHCIGQETTGPGGLAKALRTVPVALSIADVVREHARPGAWIVDFTNPVGIVTRALLEAGHRAVGLCNVAIGFQRRFAAALGVPADDVLLGHVGLNHLTWERSAVVGGVDQLPGLLSERLGELAEEVELPAPLLAQLAAVPSYYLRYYYAHDEVLAEQLAAPTRADAVRAIERELLDLYADPRTVTKPEALERRGGAFYSEAAVELLVQMSSSAGSPLDSPAGRPRVVNLRNDGALPFLPDDHVVEVPAVFHDGRFVARDVEEVPVEAQGLVAAVAAYERLALEAAVHGGRERVLSAMRSHPLVLQHERAEKLTDLLLAENARFLPWAR
ncbi:6-phospho-beta-glucosidase [Quadrisphaera granulorum]|uniref:6-phospho-beta-glucosidase n=1 Tax=Quadrisphaera granulorum TaxID=317664 RepID=A0A316A8F0_9ACTN|nr:6-phospho-beta-glucosidase [Quadrisphaera granulorum]PWJ54015.1 6-phospho-beta-glucosidase [Quadrisphaera granulorum]SZE96472.1 6-phospho-beta-glucosidase [Quadrisphaera granulorum]